MGASGVSTEPTAASITTAKPVHVRVSYEVAIQAVVAAKDSDASGGGTVGVDGLRAKEQGIPQQEEDVSGVTPAEEAEEDVANGATKDAPGAEHASGGGVKSGVAAQRSLRRRLQRQQSWSSTGKKL